LDSLNRLKIKKNLKAQLFQNVHSVTTKTMRIYLQASFPVLDPALCCKVGGFCAVEAMIVAGVVAIWKGYHYLTSLLGDLKYTHSIMKPLKFHITIYNKVYTNDLIGFYF